MYDNQTAIGYVINWTEEVKQSNSTNSTGHKQTGKSISELSSEIQIPLFTIIFLLSVIGNALVIVTLIQNKRMRTVTNVFLLNLSISDLLLSVFCMPFTLIGSLLRNFIFGEGMCRIIPFIQAICVSVSVFTLVTISMERYFAICHPLRSRRWQTLSHAKRCIAVIWFISFVIMIPIIVYTRLISIKGHRFKCREVWPSLQMEQAFAIWLDLLLFIVPLFIMLFAYSTISYTLWKGIRLELQSQDAEMTEMNSTTQKNGSILSTASLRSSASAATIEGSLSVPGPFKPKRKRQEIRSTNADKSLAAKKRVIKMLFAVVLEFFICWTPLYIINTWILFDRRKLYEAIPPLGIALFHLLAFVSSCCNPITYCFMNKKFRQGFITAFGCRYGKRFFRTTSETSQNGQSCYYGRQTTLKTVSLSCSE